jgi:hypothetical protein
VAGLLGTGARSFHSQGGTVWRLCHDRRRFFAAVSTIAAVALAVLAALEFFTSLERKDSTMSLGLILVIILIIFLLGGFSGRFGGYGYGYGHGGIGVIGIILIILVVLLLLGRI